MKKLTFVFGLFTIVFSIYSCDKIEFPLENKILGQPPIDTTGNDTTVVYTSYSDTSKTIRKILLEEFTGRGCANCPQAHIIANQLSQTYSDTLILVGMHAGFFASPNNPNSNYSTDYRTAAGNEYNSFFGISAYPSGFISRSDTINNNKIIPSGSWGTAINNLKNIQPAVKLEIGLIYTASSRSLTTKIKAYTLNSFNESYKLVIYITEDHIIDYQLDGSTHIPNYDHRHVLRGTIPTSGTWGEELIPPGTATGAIKTQTYSDYVIDSNWNVSNCSIVAYLYNSANYKIIQAEEVKIIP